MSDVREILFRGNRVDNGRWVEGSLISFGNGMRAILPSRSSAYKPKGESVFCTTKCYDVEPSTVGQYTGLTDKNGVKIFEGDILGSHYDDDYPDDIAIETIVWWNNAWCIKEGGSGPDQLTECGVLPFSEVIGNIHDNPELLKGELL